MRKFKLKLLEDAYDTLVDTIKEINRADTEQVGLVPEAVIVDLWEDFEEDVHPYQIDCGDIIGFKYDNLKEALDDFVLLIKRMKKEAVKVEFTSHLEDQYEWEDTVNNLKDHTEVLVELAYTELKRQFESGDHTAIAELLKFVPNENLVGFLDEDTIHKLN